jgi:3(or 17)beta-hydroxysteroid dehydrogenase
VGDTLPKGRFDQKVCIVTGGASGIGAATSRRLADEGGTVIVADLQAVQGRSLAAEFGADVIFLPLDVTDESSWTDLMTEVERRFGRLDVLVNCAGTSGFGTIEDTSPATWRKTLDVNSFGTFLACHFAVEAMRRSGGGSIVNIGSSLSVRARPGQLAYCASKAAVLQITRCTAIHCGQQGYNIRCNSVMPGAVDTPLLDTLRDKLGGDEALAGAMQRTHPIGRMAQPEEIASAIAYLASEDASFITAAAFAVDGGSIEM